MGKIDRRSGKVYYLELFRLNKFFNKYMVKFQVKDATIVNAVTIQLSEIYRVKINFLNELGRKVSISDVASKASIIHAGGLILKNLKATQDEQFTNYFDFEPIVHPKVNVVGSEDAKVPKKIFPLESAERSSVEKSEKEKKEEDLAVEAEIREIATKGKLRTFTRNNKNSKKSVEFLIGENGKSIPANTVIEAEVYCLTPEVFLNADKESYFKRLDVLDLETQIKEIRSHYQKKFEAHIQTDRMLRSELITENAALAHECEELKRENEKLKIGGRSREVRRLTKTLLERSTLIPPSIKKKY